MLIALLGIVGVTDQEACEREMAQWKPSAQDRQVPHADMWLKENIFAGEWGSSGPGAYVLISIKPGLTEKRFSVEVSQGGCVSMFSTRCQATYIAGTLVLDKPAYLYEPFDRFFAVLVKGKIRLTTPRNLERLYPELKQPKSSLMPIYAFARRPKIGGDGLTNPPAEDIVRLVR